MIELVDMESATPFDRLRLVLVGREGVGKSRLAATGRKGILTFDWDGRRESIAGMPGVKAATLIDPGNVNVQPTAFNDGVTLLTKLEASRTFSGIGFKKVPEGQDSIKTVVMDSVFSMAKAARAFSMYTTQDLARSLKIGSMLVRLPSGWDSWNAEVALVTQFIERLLAIKGMDVILIFHEDDEEAPGSSAEKRSYTGRYEVYPARYSNVLKYFNETWRLTRTAVGAPQIQKEPNFQFQAKSNFGDIPVKPNISEMIEAYLAKNPSVKESPRSEEVLALPSAVVEVTPIKGVKM